MTVPDFSLLVLLAYLAVISAADISTRRIPNTVTGAAVLAAGALALTGGGPAALVQAGLGLLVGLACLLPFYAAGGMGAGDVKAMAAAGAFFAPSGAFAAVGLTLIAGGVLGVCALIAHFVRLQLVVMATGASRATIPSRPPALPYGVAIAVGTGVAALNLGVLGA